ncbi:ion transporter [Daejeonella oryzae]|uniref:ion transporter n=1 Tax=Daejeonella oryzae TaxID=1122943 RepID=UPI0004139E61|nr:ion transporter [Daejeonella oryzae]
MSLRRKLYVIVFGTETKAGRRFDLVLLWLILASVLAVMLESISSVGSKYSELFFRIELIFTVIFSIEYLLRIFISPKPLNYIFSFWGLIDLISILPTYLIVLFPNFHYLLIIRSIRLMRVFRVAKLVRFTAEGKMLGEALKSSYYKISTFLFTVLITVTVMGTVMYVVEGPVNGFTSIPQSIYWAVITITTVGYGDIVPSTVVGKLVSSMVMVIGYAIIAVPTGIFTVEMFKSVSHRTECKICKHKNESLAKFCSNCGNPINEHLEEFESKS